MLEEARRLRSLAENARLRAKALNGSSKAKALLEAATFHEWEANRIERSYLRQQLLDRGTEPNA
jgi:hypothetical protein